MLSKADSHIAGVPSGGFCSLGMDRELYLLELESVYGPKYAPKPQSIHTRKVNVGLISTQHGGYNPSYAELQAMSSPLPLCCHNFPLLYFFWLLT